MTKGNLPAALKEALAVYGLDALKEALTVYGLDITETQAERVLLNAFSQAQTDPFVRAADDEPLFVLRAKDRVAPAAVRDWAERARKVGAPEARWSEAMDCARRMEAWAKVHGSKDPD